MRRIGGLLFALGSVLSQQNAWAHEASSLSCWEAFAKAQAVAAQTPGARLAWFSGTMSPTGDGDDMAFRFVYDVPASTLSVMIEPECVADACQTNVRTTTKPGLPGYGRLFMETLDKVKVDWRDAVQAALAAYPDAVWSGSFEVYTPLHPRYAESVFYYVNVEGGGQIIVDATTGETRT